MGKKIMVVDDEPDLVNLMRIMLESGGYTVISAYNGEECLNKLDEEKVDLILLDIMMPEMSGWEVFDRIKEKDGNNKVIFVSALEISGDRRKTLLNEGLADYITKPFSDDDLLGRVNKILKQQVVNPM